MIVDALKEIQKESNLKDGAFAKTFQTDRGTWNKVKNRRRKLSPRLTLNACRTYPQIREKILSPDATTQSETATSSSTTDRPEKSYKPFWTVFSDRVITFIKSLFQET